MKPAGLIRDTTQFDLGDMVLDAERAVWFARERVLVVADLHLGYVWAHRSVGHLLPLTVQETAIERLAALKRRLDPKEIVLLGDIVHRGLRIPVMKRIVRELAELAIDGCGLRWVRGNHDAGLDELLLGAGLAAAPEREVRVGNCALVHGDDPKLPEVRRVLRSRARGGRVLMGHEHPALTLGDGVASWTKCPCFLVSEKLVVLPAFTDWAGGVDVRQGRWMSPLARKAGFTHAVAVVGARLLPVPLPLRSWRE